MIIHDHFDGSANCVECHGTCKLTGEALQLTRFVRYTMEFFALGQNGWLPPQIEESLASLVDLNWKRFRQRFRSLALTHHPDKGGDPDTWQELCLARENALRDLQESA